MHLYRSDLAVVVAAEVVVFVAVVVEVGIILDLVLEVFPSAYPSVRSCLGVVEGSQVDMHQVEDQGSLAGVAAEELGDAVDAALVEGLMQLRRLM